jgi:tRNA(Ile)-lysidine synthase
MRQGKAETDPLVAAAESFIRDRRLLTAPARVVVGVSGGADSVALLAVLRELSSQPRREWHLSVAHLDHGLRPEAAADADFVRDLARRWGLQCVTERRDVAAAAHESGRGVEDAGRMIRYEFLRGAAAAAGAGYVAVGHHADDNAETVLHRIVRGTHLRGLSGMPAWRLMSGSAVRLVRPLLACRREEILAFCRRRGLDWRTDPTNASMDYRRNYIRHELLPAIRERLNPRADEALLRLAEAAGEVESWAAAEGAAVLEAARRRGRQGAVVLDATALRKAPRVVRAYAMRAALEEAGVPMRTVDSERLVELSRLAESSRSAVSLPGGFEARCARGKVVIAPAGARRRDASEPPDAP